MSDQKATLNINKWLAVSAGVYIFWVFNFLEPFGINVNGFNLIYHLMLSTYGLVSGVTVALLLYLLQSRMHFSLLDIKPHWVFISVLCLICLVSFSNWVYSQILHHTISGWHNMYIPVYQFWELMPQFLAIYAVWGLLCWTSILLLQKSTAIIYEQQAADSTQPKDEMITLYSDNQSDALKVKINHLICFKTSDNYLDVFYLNELGKLKNRMIRSSMKKMEVHLSGAHFFRSHQSFLVNKSHIKGLNKVKSSHFVEMAYLGFEVSVSRNKVKELKLFLQE